MAQVGSAGDQKTSGPSQHSQRVPAMKLGTVCLLCLLVTCLTLPIAHGHIHQRSMEIRSKESMSKGLPPANPLPPAPTAPPDSAAFGGSLWRSKELL